MKIVNEKKLQSDFKIAQRERAVDNQIYKYVCQAQKALYDLDSQKNITQPDNPLYWPKGAVKSVPVAENDLSEDEPKENLEELELLQKNPLLSNQIIHKRVPGKNSQKKFQKFLRPKNRSCDSIYHILFSYRGSQIRPDKYMYVYQKGKIYWSILESCCI